MTVKVSVVIPSVNSPSVGHTLAAIRAQHFDLSQCEVLVVGTDAAGLINEDRLVRHIDTGCAYGPARNRNIGIEHASGEILCFTDSDCVPHPMWLSRLTAPFSDSHVNVVGGGVEFDSDNYWTWCENVSWFYQFLADAPAGTRGNLPTLNLAVRREVIASAGALDERYPFPAGEDAEWTMRMRSRGFRLNFEPAAIVRHDQDRSSVRHIWRHAYNYGRYSPKVASADERMGEGIERALIPTRRIGMIAMTPLLSTLATIRVMSANKGRRRVWMTIPGVWLSKVAWCLGAAQALERDKPPERTEATPGKWSSRRDHHGRNTH